MCLHCSVEYFFHHNLSHTQNCPSWNITGSRTLHCATVAPLVVVVQCVNLTFVTLEGMESYKTSGRYHWEVTTDGKLDTHRVRLYIWVWRGLKNELLASFLFRFVFTGDGWEMQLLARFIFTRRQDSRKSSASLEANPPPVKKHNRKLARSSLFKPRREA